MKRHSINDVKTDRVRESNRYKPANDKISFSFSYLTDNKRYTFEYFGSSQMREELNARKSLDDLLKSLSDLTWIAVLRKRKNEFCGAETIQIKATKLSLSHYKISEEEKYIVFRFHNQKYRLLGLKIDNVFYICGFDFDHSAYDHG